MVRSEAQEFTLEQIFKEKYVVPDYQREYSWGKEIVKQFVDDLLYVKTNKIKNYFFASAVCFFKAFFTGFSFFSVG